MLIFKVGCYLIAYVEPAVGSSIRMADCQAECNSSLKTSLVVLYLRTFLRLSLIMPNTRCTSSSVSLEKSVPLGEELTDEDIGVLNR